MLDKYSHTQSLKNNGLDTATMLKSQSSFRITFRWYQLPQQIVYADAMESESGRRWRCLVSPNNCSGHIWGLGYSSEATSASVAYNVSINTVMSGIQIQIIGPNTTDPQQADLVVTKTVDTPDEVNDDVTFTITVSLGPTDAQMLS